MTSDLLTELISRKNFTFQDMVYVRKNLLDHEAAVLRQSNLAAKMNDTISLNNEGEVQQQPQNNQQNGSIVKQKPRALLLCQPNSHPFQVGTEQNVFRHVVNF